MTDLSTPSCLVNGVLPRRDQLIDLFYCYINLSNDADPETLILNPPFSSSARYCTVPTSENASVSKFPRSDRKGSKAEQNVLIKIQEDFSQKQIGGRLIYNIKSDDICKTIPDYMEHRRDYIETERNKFFQRRIEKKSTNSRKKKRNKRRDTERRIDRKSGVKLSDKMKKLLTNFQFEYVFLHPTLGIIIIEVKGGKSMKKKANGNWSQAEEQPFKLGLLFYLITGQTLSSCGIPVRFAMCFKYNRFRILDFPTVETEANLVDFDQKPMEFSFEDYWIMCKSKACSKNLFENEHFKVFASALVCYRGEEFVDVEQNRHVCGELIREQSLFPFLRLYRDEEDDLAQSNTYSGLNVKLQKYQVKFPVRTTVFGRSITRTPEQKRATECNDAYQLIYGPPGTGKTFILLYQAWQRAMIRQSGTIFLLTRPEYVPVIELFFIELHPTIVKKRRDANLNDNIFIGNTAGLKKKDRKRYCLIIDVRGTFGMENGKFIFNSADDVYRDEMGTNEASKKLLEHRLSYPGTGRTVCAVTGGAAAVDDNQITYFTSEFDESKRKLLKVTRLTTIMRGSVDIVEHWKKELKDCDSFQLGHSRDCGPVQFYSCTTTKQATETILEHIKELTSKKVPKNRIAIITQHNSDAEVIRNNLEKESILSVTAIEQAHLLRNEALTELEKNGTVHWTSAIRDKTSSLTGIASDYIVVDDIDKVFSFEWPYVILVPGICPDRYDSFLLLAASRAICYLKIVQYNYVQVQDIIDELFTQGLKSDLKPSLDNMEWITNAYMKAIEKMKLDFYGTDDDKKKHANFHRILTIVRNDYIVEGVNFEIHMNRMSAILPYAINFFKMILLVNCFAVLQKSVIR